MWPVPAAEFADPRTRMLLSNDGSTTVLLEAFVQATLNVVVEDQRGGAAGELAPEVRQALRLGDEQHVTLRRSLLVTADRQPVSANHVVIASVDPDDPLTPLLTSHDTPVGLGLLSAGVEQRRAVLGTGLAQWTLSDPPSPAASKTYVICAGGCPRLYLREVYNPALFPAGLHLRNDALWST